MKRGWSKDQPLFFIQFSSVYPLCFSAVQSPEHPLWYAHNEISGLQDKSL
jgi:hypothetical protein